MAAEIKVPAELQVCLREFTKAVLRDMPENVLEYSKDYFVEKAQQIRMDSYKLPASTSKPFQELAPALQQQIEDVFKRYDVDCDMSISIEELRTLNEKRIGQTQKEGHTTIPSQHHRLVTCAVEFLVNAFHYGGQDGHMLVQHVIRHTELVESLLLLLLLSSPQEIEQYMLLTNLQTLT